MTHLNQTPRRESEYAVFEEKAGVGWEGLEPSTNALKGRCSTIELPTRAEDKLYILFQGLQP